MNNIPEPIGVVLGFIAFACITLALLALSFVIYDLIRSYHQNHVREVHNEDFKTIYISKKYIVKTQVINDVWIFFPTMIWNRAKMTENELAFAFIRYMLVIVKL